MNGVKPSQGKSNQFNQAVKVVAKPAKFAGLGTDQSWQEVNLAGELGDNIWQGVPDIVSYCQLLSDKFTYCHVWSHIGEKYFLRAARIRKMICFVFYGQFA